MKKVVVLVSCIVIIFISVLIAASVINDNVAKKTASELTDLPLPNNTEFIESVYRAGKLVGNGNGMQYFGTIFHEFDIRGH